MKARVYLKSGAVVEADVLEFSVTKSITGAGYTSVEWKTPAKRWWRRRTKLMSVRLEEIDAVTVEQ